jgi:hypothetical protein
VSAPFACCFCDQAVNDHYREVTGWEVRRAGGGANQIVGRKETGRFACNACIRQIRDGLPPASPTLL